MRDDRIGLSGIVRRIPRRFSLPIFAAASLIPVGLGNARAAGPAPVWHEDGQASYYSRHWIGRRTSSGEVFDPHRLTAAHASLPLGTRILVTNERSGESVVVTVNDRQPDHGHRIIDLSPAAASRLHMLGSGVAEVEISEAGAADLRANDEEVAEAPDDDAAAVAEAPLSHHRPTTRHHLRRR